MRVGNERMNERSAHYSANGPIADSRTLVLRHRSNLRLTMHLQSRFTALCLFPLKNVGAAYTIV